MIHPFLYPIIIPFIAGTICFVIPKKTNLILGILGIAGSAITFGFTIWLFAQKPMEWTVGTSVLLRLDHLSSFIFLASGLFGFLISFYSFKYMKNHPRLNLYYGTFLWTVGASCGAILANHLILFLFFWGILAITLYLLILTGNDDAAPVARKTLLIVGGSDALVLLGIILIYRLSGSYEMNQISLSFNGPMAYFAYIFLALGAFAKAGAMPLHTWIPGVAERAPIPVTGFLPAALDKLLGIYLLARLSLYLFQMTAVMNLALMIIGSLTIIMAVMMALIQHDLKKLLAYHAVSQVGYMLLGIGTGNPIGIAGGLFHMLNNSIYKSCLFLTGGAVKHRVGTTNLDELGGLGRLMPVTFISFAVAALAISGIPPLNGFVSKWMIYQGLVELGRAGDKLWVIWLVAAMFGSALTIASFMKLTHAIFLGVPSEKVNQSKIREVGFWMAGPSAVLALLCIIFGVFAYAIPLKMFIIPAVSGIAYSGMWSPGLATIMILAGFIVGIIIYLSGNLKGVREAESFIGGENIPANNRVTGTEFYQTIHSIPFFKKIYFWTERKWFDIYEQLDRLALSIASAFRKMHTGVLSNYLSWSVVGFILILVFLIWR